MKTRTLLVAISFAGIFTACNNDTPEAPQPQPIIAETAPETETPPFDAAALLVETDAKRAEIEANLDKYEKLEMGKEKLREKTRQKWEKIHFYQEGGKVVRIKSYPYANISKRTEEFYFDNGNLILVVIEDNGDAAVNNEEADRLYYFHDGEAFNEISKGDEEEFSTLKAEGEELMEEANEYLELLKKN